MQVETIRTSEMTGALRGAWTAFRNADPNLASPYFDLRYLLAAGEIAPGAALAVLRRQGRVIGFLPIQRRRGTLQPLGAPLSDYHGLVAEPGAGIDLAAVIAALGARRFRFGGYLGEAGGMEAAVTRPAMAANLAGGFEGYLEGRRSAGLGGFLKDKRRRLRRLGEEVGEVAFRLDAGSPAELDFIFALKRDQMRRTGQHDVFACDWTRRLLQTLSADTDADFGLMVASLTAGGRLIAAEAGLLSGGVYHLWFPVYEPEFGRYSPGALLTLETMKALAERGVAHVDFGPGEEVYKSDWAEPWATAVEGEVAASPLARGARAATRAALSPAPAFRRAVEDAQVRLDRRLDRITACEPRVGRMTAAARVLLGAGLRGASRSSMAAAGAGLGLAGLGLRLLD